MAGEIYKIKAKQTFIFQFDALTTYDFTFRILLVNSVIFTLEQKRIYV